jgi:hypothetical protein
MKVSLAPSFGAPGSHILGVSSSRAEKTLIYSQRNATFVLFKAQDFYWLTILLLCPQFRFSRHFGGKRCVSVFVAVKLLFVVCNHALCRAQRNLNDAVAT